MVCLFKSFFSVCAPPRPQVRYSQLIYVLSNSSCAFDSCFSFFRNVFTLWVVDLTYERTSRCVFHCLMMWTGQPSVEPSSGEVERARSTRRYKSTPFQLSPSCFRYVFTLWVVILTYERTSRCVFHCLMEWTGQPSVEQSSGEVDRKRSTRRYRSTPFQLFTLNEKLSLNDYSNS